MKQGIIHYIPLDQIEPDPDQPRKYLIYSSEAKTDLGVSGIDNDIDDRSLDDDRSDATSLADSVLAHGVLQPILVQQLTKKRFQIIAGERRWRAAVAAKERIDGGEELKPRPGYDYATIPALIFDSADRLDSRTKLETQLVENVQRREMDAWDIGEALKTLADAGSSMRDIARNLGKNTGWVQNMLFAATPTGRELYTKFGKSDWHGLRRLNAQKTERPTFLMGGDQRPSVWDAVMERVEHGEIFGRSMLEEEIAAWDADAAEERQRARESLNEYQAREARDEEHGTVGMGDAGEIDEDPDAIRAEMEQDARDAMRRPTPRYVQAYRGTGPKRMPGETDAQWLYRATERAFEELVEDDRSGEEMMPGFAPGMEEPGIAAIPVPDPKVTLHVVLPRTQVKLLAGLLDDLETMDLPEPHAEDRAAKDITAQLEALARRLHKALD